MPIPWVSLAIYSATALMSQVLKGKKRPNSPIYKTRESNEDYSQERRVPLVYGHNKVRGTIVYREDKDGSAYDMAVAFCEGPIEEIGLVTLDDASADEIAGSGDNAITRYLGTEDQAADAIMAEGVYRMTAVADAYVDADNPTTNYDTEELHVKSLLGGIPKKYTYLKFDLSELPSGLTIEDAWIEMHSVYRDLPSSLKIQSLSSESWAEDTITWDTKPTAGSDISGTFGNVSKFKILGRSGTLFNSTGKTYVQTQYNAGTTCSVVIVNGSTNSYEDKWSSTESAYQSPKLGIKFSGGDASAFKNTAYVALTVDTDDERISSHIPSVEAEIKGKKILNWDESGSAWQTTYCANPAWVLYHYLTNTRSAAGISSSRIDTDTFKAVASYCDAEVTVDGETGPRFECHLNLDDRRTGDDDVQDILATFGGYIYQQDGLLCLGVEKADTPDSDFDFDDSNIVAGSFSYWQAERERIPNVVRVLYTDPEKEFVKTHAQAEDVIDIDDRGRVMKEVPIYGINSRSQAARMAQYILYKGLKVRWGCTFRVGINHCHISPGIIVTVTKTEAGWTNKQFRVIEISETDRDEIDVTLEEYVASLYSDDGGPGDYNEQPVILDGDAAPLVTALSATETYEIGDDGTYQPQIQVAFTKPSNAYYLKYIIWLKEGAGSYVCKANVTSSPYIIDVTKYTTYTVRVTTHNSLSQKESVYADSPTDTVTVTGQANTPSMPQTSGIDWTTNSRAEWTTGSIYYKGTTYAISSGNTTNPYIYFDPDISTTVLQTASSVPTFGTNGYLIATYDGTTDKVYPISPVKVLHAGLLMVGTIIARPYVTSPSGARLEIFPDANTGIRIIDDASNDVFKVLVGGTDVGDVIIGDWAGGQGIKYDKSTGLLSVLGSLGVTTVDWSDVVDDGGKPDDNADVTATVLTSKGIADGATAGATWGVNVASVPARFTAGDTPTADGVYITPNYIGFWDNGTSSWTVRIKNNAGTGEFFVGNTSKYVSWNGSALTVVGTIQTSGGTGKRTVLDNSDNTLRMYNSSNTNVVTIDDSILLSRPGIKLTGTYGGIIYVIKDANNYATLMENSLFLKGSDSNLGIDVRDETGAVMFGVTNLGVVSAASTINAVGGLKENGTAISSIYAPLSHNHSTLYAPIAKGVTNGDSHNHDGGDGGTINLSSIYADSSVPGSPTKVFGWTASYGYGLYTL